jgi:hypothetical protein
VDGLRDAKEAINQGQGTCILSLCQSLIDNGLKCGVESEDVLDSEVMEVLNLVINSKKQVYSLKNSK